MRISVIVPVRDERENVGPLAADLRAALRGLDWEAIFVDDGSNDGTAETLKELARRDRRIKVLQLRKNYGQSAATQAGFDAATGEAVVTLDGDRQNDPADIPRLVTKLAEGYDAVLGLRVKRQDAFLVRTLPSLAANWLIRRVLGIEFKDFGCSIRAMRREIVEDIQLYGEMHRFLPALLMQQGARVAQVPVRHHPRAAGRSKYNLSRTLRVLLDLMTVKFFATYQSRPMHFFGSVGAVLLVLGGAMLAASLAMQANALLVLGAIAGLFGAQCFGFGLIGEMLTRNQITGGVRVYRVREAFYEPRGLPPWETDQHSPTVVNPVARQACDIN